VGTVFVESQQQLLRPRFDHRSLVLVARETTDRFKRLEVRDDHELDLVAHDAPSQLGAYTSCDLAHLREDGLEHEFLIEVCVFRRGQP
jgi:hypothetical protein